MLQSTCESEKASFQVNGMDIERVREYKYLGRTLMENDTDKQLRKAKDRWNCVAKILKREGACARTMTRFYLLVV